MKPTLFCIFLLAGISISKIIRAQKNSGIFYTTLFAKERPYKRLEGVGFGASHLFLKDVDGDGKDDAVAYFKNGDWYVALSNGTLFGSSVKYLGWQVPGNVIPLMGDVNGDGKQDAIYFYPDNGSWMVSFSMGTSFTTPVQWTLGNGVGSVDQFLTDVNDDGKDDAVIYFNTGGLAGSWYVGLSNGINGFGAFSSWISGFGNSSTKRLMGDVNGDGKADAVHYTKSTGTWNVALSNGAAFVSNGTWRNGFGTGKDQGFVYDVDRDGKSDIVYYNSGEYDNNGEWKINSEWWVRYSTGTNFGDEHRWVVNNRPPNSKGNVPGPYALLLGSMSGTLTETCVVSNAEWLCLGNADKGTTADATFADTWTVWGNDYEPQVPGHPGTYDCGDNTIIDIQLQMIHDAGFTYIMFDITNGVNAWVDNRAKQFIQRIKNWNSNLLPGRHKMFFCMAMGGSRRAPNTDNAMEIIESESQWAWNDFYLPNADDYYTLNGKPLLVHFVECPASSPTGQCISNSDVIKNYSGSVPHANYDKFTIRWMYNAIYNQPAYSNAYGWPIYDQFGNPFGNEVMDVMPGFWNGSSGSPRAQGQLYRSQWMRVLQYNPASVWVNSFNESWEHTAVEPSYIKPSNTLDKESMDNTWTDYYGDRMDDFYWKMTVQYNRLYMYNQLFDGSYLQEHGNDSVFKVTGCSYVWQGSMPHQAPVLMVPAGFMRSFSGQVVDASFNNVCFWSARKEQSFTAQPDTMKKANNGTLAIKVYPNPARTQFTVTVGNNDNLPVTITVMDVSGRIVERINAAPANSTRQIGDHYSPGIYLLELSTRKTKEIRRITRL